MRYCIVLFLLASFTIPAYGQEDSTFNTVNDADTAVIAVSGADDVENEEIYILSDFEVSASDDQGYFSANSNSATRTNSLVKNTPITMSIVNEELLSDLGIQSSQDLAAVIAGIDTDPDGYSFDQIRIRGFRTSSATFDSFPRNLARDNYNINRIDVIKGANSLIFGQASPGGTVNTIPQLANFNKNIQSLSHTFGNKDYKRTQFLLNQILSDKLAVKLMGVDTAQNFDGIYKKNEMQATTLAVTYQLSPNSRLRGHFEHVDSDVNLSIRTMRDATKLDDNVVDGTSIFDVDKTNDTYNGLLSRYEYEVPFSPDYVQYLPQPVVDHIKAITNLADYKYSINSREDIAARYAGINSENFGAISGPDKINDRDGIFCSAFYNLTATDNLEIELAVGLQTNDGHNLTRSDSASRVVQTFTLWDPDTRVDNNTRVQYDVGSPFMKTFWQKNNWDAERLAYKATFVYDLELGSSKHKMVGGLDYMMRDYNAEFDDMIPVGAKNNNGSYIGLNALTKDQVNDKFRAFEYFDLHNLVDNNFSTDVAGIAFDYESDSTVTILPVDGLGSGVAESPDVTANPYTISANYTNVVDDDNNLTYPNSEWARRQNQSAEVNTNSQWLAFQSDYLDGRLHTLIGARLDRIDVKANIRKVAVYGLEDPLNDDGFSINSTEKYTKVSPSIGGLYWINPSIGVFANYAESIQSPSGTQFNPIGEIVEPEYGRGYETGIRFKALDDKIDGQFVFYTIEKENDDEFRYTTGMLNTIYPSATYGEEFPYLYYKNPGAGGTDEAPLGGIIKGAMIGQRSSGDMTQSKGIEFEGTYNPNKNLTLIASYNYTLENTVKSLHPSITTEQRYKYFYQGDQLLGRPDHRANFTARYKFTKGSLKNLLFGINQSFRSKSMQTFFNLPDGTQFPLEFDDEHTTNIFVGYSKKLGIGRSAPLLSLKANVNNLFDNTDLVNRGSYGFYREGRTLRLTSKILF